MGVNHNNFGRFLKLVQFEEIIVTKNGKKVAVLKPYPEPEGNDLAAKKAEDYDWHGEKITYEDFLKLSQESDSRYE